MSGDGGDRTACHVADLDEECGLPIFSVAAAYKRFVKALMLFGRELGQWYLSNVERPQRGQCFA